MPPRRQLPWRTALPILLLLAAATNLLIAWAFLIFTPPPAPGTLPTKMELIHARSRAELRAHLPPRLFAQVPYRADFQLARQPLMIAYERRDKLAVRAESAQYMGRETTVVTAGFPLRAASYTIDRPRFVFPLAIDTHWGIYLPGIQPSWPGGALSAAPLPLRPEPLPFLANTILYAIVLLIAWRLLRRISRAGIQEHRRQHGRCLACGYDLTHIPTPRCPECGTATTEIGATPPRVPSLARCRRAQ